MPGLVRTQSVIDISASGGGGFVTPLPPFFNSQEPRDSNTLLADDFSRGSWYKRDADHQFAGGSCDDGANWLGGIFWTNNGSPCFGPPNGAATQTCNFGPSAWCAEHQYRNSVGGSTMADHMLVNGADSETEMYLRWYQRFSSGYSFGAEKVFTVNRDTGGGIFWGNVHFNIGAGSPGSTGAFQWQPQVFDSNVSSGFSVTGNGHWYCLQIHLKLNTPGATPGTDGTVAMYADDCGTSGLSHPGSPTLRVSRTNYQFNRTSSSQKMGNIWKENWANPASDGSSDVAYMYASRVGPIPFVDSWP